MHESVAHHFLYIYLKYLYNIVMDVIDSQVEHEDDTEQILPEIPTGYIRLTHFTDKGIAQSIIQEKKPFSYEKQGEISSTTDAFISNKDILDLVRTGKFGPLERGPFGNGVIIIDLDQEEHKNRYRVGYCINREIPNHNILGYIDRESPNVLNKNPEYKPQKNQLILVPPIEIKNWTTVNQPISQEGETSETDIW